MRRYLHVVCILCGVHWGCAPNSMSTPLTQAYPTASSTHLLEILQTSAYATFQGLPAVPDGALQATLGEPAWHGSNTSGESNVAVEQAMYRLEGVAAPVHVFSRGDTVLRIGIAYPAIPDVPALLQALGEPALRLDYHLDVAVMRGLRWVFPARGIALDLNDDHSVVIGICLFVPTSAAAYRAEIHTSAPIREIPPQDH